MLLLSIPFRCSRAPLHVQLLFVLRFTLYTFKVMYNMYIAVKAVPDSVNSVKLTISRTNSK